MYNNVLNKINFHVIKFIWIIVIILILLLISGCSNSGDLKISSVPHLILENVNVVIEEQRSYYPLTGEKMGHVNSQRPVAVVVSNYPEARPQTGLIQADFIFEYLVEGNITRLLALFHSEMPTKVGPIRSARPYFIETAKGYGSFFVAHGYSEKAEEMLKGNVIDHINGMTYDAILFERDSSRIAPHNSYISGGNIIKGAGMIGASLVEPVPGRYSFLSSGEDQLELGVSSSSFTINYNDDEFSPTYVYDSNENKYRRFIMDKVTEDRETTEEVLLTNVLVLKANHSYEQGSSLLRVINLTFGGDGYLFQNGVKINVKWKNIDGRIAVFLGESELKLGVGKTWVNFVPDLSDVR